MHQGEKETYCSVMIQIFPVTRVNKVAIKVCLNVACIIAVFRSRVCYTTKYKDGST